MSITCPASLSASSRAMISSSPRAIGYADIEAKTPMTPEHRQRIGSITKTMTALCVMALVDEGRLSLDSRVVDLLPDMPFDGPVETLTIKHLLTHTGGIGEAPTMQDLPRMLDFLYTLEPDASRVPEAYPNGITIEVPPGDEVGVRQSRLRAARRDHHAARGRDDRRGHAPPHLRAARHDEQRLPG